MLSFFKIAFLRLCPPMGLTPQNTQKNRPEIFRNNSILTGFNIFLFLHNYFVIEDASRHFAPPLGVGSACVKAKSKAPALQSKEENRGFNLHEINLDTSNRGCNLHEINLDTSNRGCNLAEINLGTSNRGCNLHEKNLDTSNHGCNLAEKNLGTSNRGCNLHEINLGTSNRGCKYQDSILITKNKRF